MIVSQPNKKKVALDSSLALIGALQCCVFFQRIERYPFQMLPYLYRVRDTVTSGMNNVRFSEKISNTAELL